MNKINKLGDRLKKIGIDVEFSANYPWIYLRKVNGNYVKERFRAEHGFTAFMLTMDNEYEVTNIREIFEVIRKYTN